MKKKDISLVSVMNKSQYRDTHSEDPSVTCETLIIFPLFGAVKSEQYCLYVRTGLLLSHETRFYSIMNDSKEISAIS